MKVRDLIRDLSLMAPDSEVVVETLRNAPRDAWETLGPVACVTRKDSGEVRLTVIKSEAR